MSYRDSPYEDAEQHGYLTGYRAGKEGCKTCARLRNAVIACTVFLSALIWFGG